MFSEFAALNIIGMLPAYSIVVYSAMQQIFRGRTSECPLPFLGGGTVLDGILGEWAG